MAPEWCIYFESRKSIPSKLMFGENTSKIGKYPARLWAQGIHPKSWPEQIDPLKTCRRDKTGDSQVDI